MADTPISDALLAPLETSLLSGGYRTVSAAELANAIHAVRLTLSHMDDRIRSIEVTLDGDAMAVMEGVSPAKTEPADPVDPPQTAVEPEPSSEGAAETVAVEAEPVAAPAPVYQ